MERQILERENVHRPIFARRDHEPTIGTKRRRRYWGCVPAQFLDALPSAGLPDARREVSCGDHESTVRAEDRTDHGPDLSPEFPEWLSRACVPDPRRLVRTCGKHATPVRD